VEVRQKEVPIQSISRDILPFQGSLINDCLDKVKSAFKEQVKTLLNPKFQLFEESAGVTA